MMKHRTRNLLLTAVMLLTLPLTTAAQYGTLSPLHTEGTSLRDGQGNRVVLHGVMDTPSPYFNNGHWGSSASVAYVNRCIEYFNKLYSAVTSPEQGTYCNVFRLHLDPCWCFTNGKDESDYEAFNMSRFKQFWEKLYRPLILNAMDHGLYVVVRPPGVCPENISVGDGYNEYLTTVWDYVSKDDSIRKYSGYISIELANEPVNLNDADGNATPRAPHDFFQPIYDRIRQNGFTGIVWIPGTGYQSIYTGYETYPIEGYNVGYAVHNYPGWYGGSDKQCDPETYIAKFEEMVPVVKTNPVIITEIDWSPEKEGEGKYNEFGEWVPANYGTWGTASTSKWGQAYKALIDKHNISMTLTGTADYIDVTELMKSGSIIPAFKGITEACGEACWQWYKDYAQTNCAYPAFARTYTSDQGDGTYVNPILNADFPDPDVIRVGDTFYMSTTTMFHFPGVTVMKSKDLVNWEYCANPLEQIADTDPYNLQNGQNRYAGGAWASTLKYRDGRFYLGFLAFGDDGGYFLLDTDNPEGKWNIRKLSEGYYDSGLMFDNDGKTYIVHGINHISVTELDANFNKIRTQEVIVRDDSGLEGNHFYHIGDYYYIYSTYGGTEGSQTIFRATSPMGPYTECGDRLMKGQHIHQGSLVDTPTGEWWTILFKDAGPIGRVPYLEPVTWKDGWPVLGNNGTDVSKGGAAFRKPDVGQAHPITTLPTNDTFTSLKLGMQWQWNHNPDNTSWSLIENPGCLRLYTSGISQNLKQARNSLTQRMVALDPEGTMNSKRQMVYGTVKLNTANMKEGDVAGLSVFQDPYSYLAIKVMDGKRHLWIYREAYDNNAEVSKDCGEIASDVVYLQARANFGTNRVTYYYSTDNVEYTRAASNSFEMRYIVSIFVGQRFYLFNYATKANGGYVDIDWFTTEQSFDEERFYSEEALQTYSPEDLMLDHIEADADVEMLNGGNMLMPVFAVMKSGLRRNVAAECTYSISDESVLRIERGTAHGLRDGHVGVTAYYTDLEGTTMSATATVTVSTFPLTATAFNPSISGKGTFDAATGSLTTSKGGLAGWEYTSGVDLSPYKFIVIELAEKPATTTSFKLFDTDDAGGTAYSRTLTAATTKINLTNVKTVNKSAIRMAGFTTNGTAAIKLSRVFLSDDGITPSSIINTSASGEIVYTEVYDLSGRRIAAPQNGVSIVRHRMADGSMRTVKVVGTAAR